MNRRQSFSPVQLARAGSIVKQRTGLVFREPRRSALVAGLMAGLRRSGTAAEEYIERLSTDRQLLDELVVHITVGETYFFRDTDQFSTIRDVILPDLSASNVGRAVRLWSAGCATGEEAYSLAILMHERREAARIIATDISRSALARGRKAVYREWSLRGVPEAVVGQYFRRSQGRFELHRQIRDAVEFRYLNLAESRAYPAVESGITDMDLILCRNVLIYFDAATVKQVASRLIDSLSPGGWLLVGASDPPLQDLVPCEMVLLEGGRVFRRPAASQTRAKRAADRRNTDTNADRRRDRDDARIAARTDTASRVRRSVPPRTLPTAERPRQRPSPDPQSAIDPDPPRATPDMSDRIAELYRLRRYDDAAELAAKHAGTACAGPDVWILLVRAHANRGELRQADAACLAALEHHPLHAELAYLHGILMVEADRAPDAVQAFRRAIFLDRTLVVAHLALGQVLSRTGRVHEARRAFRNAEQLLVAMPSEMAVPGADGETVARLLSLTRTLADVTK